MPRSTSSQRDAAACQRIDPEVKKRLEKHRTKPLERTSRPGMKRRRHTPKSTWRELRVWNWRHRVDLLVRRTTRKDCRLAARIENQRAWPLERTGQPGMKRRWNVDDAVDGRDTTIAAQRCHPRSDVKWHTFRRKKERVSRFDCCTITAVWQHRHRVTRAWQRQTLFDPACWWVSNGFVNGNTHPVSHAYGQSG